MESKHTPAPWVLEWDSDSDDFGNSTYWPCRITNPELPPVDFGTGRVIVDFENSVADEDARLMAASPDLLEALILAVNDAERGRNAVAEANKEMGFDEPKKLDWVVAAEAAIKKATQP